MFIVLAFLAGQSIAQTYTVSGTITNGPTSTVTLSGASPVLVQSVTGASTVGTIQTTASFSAIAGGGNSILVFLRFGGTTVSSVTDTLNNKYVSVLGPTQWGVAPNSTDRWAQVFVASNIAGGSTVTITVTLAGTSTHDTYVAAMEYSGVDPVHPVNTTAVGTGTYPANGAPATGNMITTVANTKVVATGWDSNESYTSAENGSGYATDTAAGIKSISGGSGWANLSEDRTAPTAGVWNATTAPASQLVDWVIQAVALAPAGAAQNTTADGGGNYSFSNLNNGTYSVVPSSANYSFTPTYQSVHVNGVSVSGVNFTAAAKTGSISGNISPASAGNGSTVTLSGAVPTLVQTAGNAVPAGNSMLTNNFGVATNAGDAVVLFLRFGGTTVSSVTDNQNNIYTSAVGPTPWGTTGGGGTDRVAQVFVAKNIAGKSALSLTVKLAGSSTHSIYAVALEYSGVDVTNPINTFAVGTGTVGSNGAPITGNMNTTVANAKLVATSWDSNESYSSTGNGSGYTTILSAGIPSIAGGSGWANLSEDRTAATAGTWNAGASSLPAVVDWAIQVVALKPGASQSTTALSDGSYAFNVVPNGTYTVTPSALGTTFTPPSQQVTVNGTNVSNVNFTANQTVGTIGGTVKDSVTGNPISGATVSYSGGSQTATTDQNGNYQLTVAIGTYTVTAGASAYQSSSQTNVTVMANTTTTVNFALAQPGKISGLVKNTAGIAIANATVSYTGGSTTTAADGTYTLSDVVPGTYNVTASATNYQSSTQSTIVSSGQTSTLNFALASMNGTISGNVSSNLTGNPIPGATVSYSGGSQTASTDPNGNYHLTVLPGTYSVTARATGYQSSTQSNVTVSSNATTTANFALTPLGSVTGFVKNTAGAAVAGATVSYSGGSAKTAPDGSYTLSNVVPGTYNVTTSATNYQNSTQSASVNPSQVSTLNFTLSPLTGGINGKVQGAGGKAIAGATLTIVGGIVATTRTTTTNTSGVYSVAGVPVGNYTVTASKIGYTTQKKTTTVSSNSTSTVNFNLK